MIDLLLLLALIVFLVIFGILALDYGADSRPSPTPWPMF
jgi:hypothetical protein